MDLMYFQTIVTPIDPLAIQQPPKIVGYVVMLQHENCINGLLRRQLDDSDRKLSIQCGFFLHSNRYTKIISNEFTRQFLADWEVKPRKVEFSIATALFRSMGYWNQGPNGRWAQAISIHSRLVYRYRQTLVRGHSLQGRGSSFVWNK